jgi:hypothetical protein
VQEFHLIDPRASLRRIDQTTRQAGHCQESYEDNKTWLAIFLVSSQGF